MKRTRPIRVNPEDHNAWKEYCKLLNTDSAQLFNRILKSKELNLNDRLMSEYRKKQEDLNRRFLKF